MGNETEIKLKIDDPRALERALRKIGAKPRTPGCPRVREENILFDTADSSIARAGQLLRIRTELADGKGKKAGAAERTLLTFKRPIVESSHREAAVLHHDYKVREELELEVADGATLGRIFAGLGLKGWFRYEKYRTTYKLPLARSWAKGLLIEVDETPIGTYVELEGPEPAIDRAAAELGFSKRDYITKNYLLLYLEECKRRGQPARDMVFPAASPPRKPRSR
jgi:adenylate cyclase class 2